MKRYVAYRYASNFHESSRALGGGPNSPPPGLLPIDDGGRGCGQRGRENYALSPVAHKSRALHGPVSRHVGARAPNTRYGRHRARSAPHRQDRGSSTNANRRRSGISGADRRGAGEPRSEEHTSELQSRGLISSAGFRLKTKS